MIAFFGLPTLCFIGNLPALMIHMIIFPKNQLRDRYNLITFSLKSLNQRVKRVRRILGPIVAEDDAAVSQMLVLGYRFYDGVHPIILPVQTVPAGKGFKSLEHKGFRDFVLES